MRALELSAEIDKELCEWFPNTYNHLLSTGYFATHSARMSKAGMMGVGGAKAPPYLIWSAHIQPFSHLEFSANYRIFRGCEDASIGAFGFGDYADRGANFKAAIFTPEDSQYALPGLSFGIDDFMGSKKFTNYFIVATQVMRDWGLELSLGWGAGCYSNGPTAGFFGAAQWFPLWQSSCAPWVRGFALAAELDPCNYTKDPHPDGRTSRSLINIGAKYTLADCLELSACYVRGEAFACSGSINYNWGGSFGFVPKIKDPPCAYAPIDQQPLGIARPQPQFIQELNAALHKQGFRVGSVWMQRGCGIKRLYLTLTNLCYRQEHVVRMRLTNALASLIPADLQTITVVIESNGLFCQQYTFDRDFLLGKCEGRMGGYEFDILTPREDPRPPTGEAQLLFRNKLKWLCPRLAPRFETFFGSSRGKFKYDLGVKGLCEGLLPYNFFYELQASYTALSTLENVADSDFFYPSNLPNVATDYVRYRQESAFTWDMLYVQKSLNFPCAFFARAALGYFQVNYAGVAAELLWYPAHSNFAVGLEGALVKKRSYSGLGFVSTLRQFEGREPVYVPYGMLQQVFLDFYLDLPSLCFFTKVSLGQFLARDVGARVDITRYFDNGVRLSGWITLTNAEDIMHGERYFDRGIALEIPLDLFFKRSSRRVWNYAMAAWLRDAGYAIKTGRALFDTLNRERRW